MFKIDNSTVKHQATGQLGVVIKQWVQQAPADDIAEDTSEKEAEEADATEIDAKREAARAALEESARQRAEAILAKAAKDADALIAAANMSVEGIKDKAWHDGYQGGLAEAEKENEAFREATQKAFDAFLLQLKAERDARDEALSDAIVTLSLEIAKKIVAIELDRNDDIYIGFVKEAIERLNAKEKFTIHVNQEEYDRFFADGTGWLAEQIQCPPFVVVADANVTPLGLTLRAQSGMVEAGVDTRFAKTEEALNNG